MADPTPFSSIADVIMKGQQAVKGSFILETGMDGNTVSDEEKNYLRMFNANWLAKSQPLTSQLSKFLVSIYKAEGMTAAELKVNPGLTITQDIINSWRQITLTQHQEFVLGVTNVTERMFSSPDIEVELSVTVRKKRHETQLVMFNKLQTLAAEKLVELDDFIGLQVCIRYELFTEKVKGFEFSRLLCQGQGPSSEASSTSTPATS